MTRGRFLATLAMALSFFVANPASAENRWVTIHNLTGYDIITFHGSHRDAKTWQEDILGDSILRAGQSVDVNFYDGTGYCIFDFRAEFSDGEVLVKKSVNVCEVADFYYE